MCVGFVDCSNNESINDYLYWFLFGSVRGEMEIGVSLTLTYPEGRNGAIIFPLKWSVLSKA
jgi:hypothetical protein